MLFIEDRNISNLVYFKYVRTTRRTENIHYISEYSEGTIFLSDMLFYSPKQEKQYPMVISESRRYWKIFSELFYANTEEKEITILDLGTTKGKMKNNLHQNLVLEKQTNKKKDECVGLSLYPGFDSIVLKATGEKNLYQLCGTVTVLYKDRLTLQGFCLSRISSLQKIAFSFQTDLFLFHWDHRVRPVRLASQVTHLWTLILIGYFVIDCSRYSNGKVHMNQKKG